VKDGSGWPQEVGHFILDIEDNNLRSNAQALYGDKPKVLDITFFSDRIEDVFRCTLQRWVKDKQGISRLLCEGTGTEAIEGGRMRLCPCPALGSGCQKKTVLKFLIPRLTIGGYFLLATRSDNNADNIETGLKLIKRTTGGLIMREMSLKRTEGYATVNGVRTRKFYVALEGHYAVPAITAAAVPAVKPQEGTPAAGQSVAGMTSLGTLLRPPDACTLARQEELRLRDGRHKVREKIRLFIMEPGAEAAAEKYACIRFSKKCFEDLSVDQLLELWHSIDDDETTLGDIYTIFLASRSGLPEVQRG
jgi:hypothetical protein